MIATIHAHASLPATRRKMTRDRQGSMTKYLAHGFAITDSGGAGGARALPP